MKSYVALPLLLVFLVTSFIALAPATLADRTLDSASGGRLRIGDARGTVWRGSGWLTDATGTWRAPVAWSASPLAALRGAIDVVLTPQGHVVANGGLAVQDLRLALPAAALGNFLPSVPAVDLGGELRVETPSFRYDGRAGDGMLAVRWERARAVVNGTLVDFGTAVARIVPRGADLVGSVSSEGGMLRVNGSGTWSKDQINAAATLTPIAPLPPEIAQALTVLGPADASGAVRVTWRASTR